MTLRNRVNKLAKKAGVNEEPGIVIIWDLDDPETGSRHLTIDEDKSNKQVLAEFRKRIKIVYGDKDKDG